MIFSRPSPPIIVGTPRYRSLKPYSPSKVVTYDFARLMDGATEVKCSEFGNALIENMA